MGSFLGHLISGGILTVNGFLLCYAAMLQFRRGKRAQKDRKGTHLSAASSTDARDDFVTRLLSGTITYMYIAIFLGMFCIFFVEMPNNPLVAGVPPQPKHGFPHQFNFAGYVMCALSVILEKKGLLPFTSSTWMFAVANGNNYIIDYYHSHHQEGSEAIFHQMSANICLLSALCCGLLGFLQVSRQRDMLHVPAFLAFYLMALHGMVLLSVGCWYYKWFKPVSDEEFEIPEWQPPCVFSACVLSSLAILGVIWNWIRCRDEQCNNDSDHISLPLSNQKSKLEKDLHCGGDGSCEVQEETLPLSTEEILSVTWNTWNFVGTLSFYYNSKCIPTKTYDKIPGVPDQSNNQGEINVRRS